MDLGLAGKVVMVAGASRGLGFAVAQRLAAEGARVSIASRDAGAIEKASRQIAKEAKAEVLGVACDVRQTHDIERWEAATTERFGGIDGLFANSGGPPAGGALTFDDNAWQDAFALIVLSVIRMTRVVVPRMEVRGGGSILVSTSTSVKEPITSLALSTVLRASVSALSKTLALELAPSRIRVNQIVPGRIDTDRVRELDEGASARLGISIDEQRRRVEATIPLGRYGSGDEYAHAAALLLSDAASYITGASLQVDGGMIRSIL
jgi:3-oxoacyl-[acyl-carrier protein] reductase